MKLPKIRLPKLSRRMWIGLAGTALAAAGVQNADRIAETANVLLDAAKGHSPVSGVTGQAN